MPGTGTGALWYCGYTPCRDQSQEPVAGYCPPYHLGDICVLFVAQVAVEFADGVV